MDDAESAPPQDAAQSGADSDAAREIEAEGDTHSADGDTHSANGAPHSASSVEVVAEQRSMRASERDSCCCGKCNQPCCGKSGRD